ncbi:hypothetical protein F4810DRAFT_726533 [Camillea tinctor]|nr:hypothetical protein F4810DRAFT_726533 [Camillea tinctor]
MSLRGRPLALVLDLVHQHHNLLNSIFSAAPDSWRPDFAQSCEQLQDKLQGLVDPQVYVLLSHPDLYSDNARRIVWNRIRSRLRGIPKLSPFRYSNINPHRHIRLDDHIWNVLPGKIRGSLPMNISPSYGVANWLRQGSPSQYRGGQSGHNYSSLIDSLCLEVTSHADVYQPASMAAAESYLYRLGCLSLDIRQFDAFDTLGKLEARPQRGKCKYCTLVRQANIMMAGLRISTAARNLHPLDFSQQFQSIYNAFQSAWAVQQEREQQDSRGYARVSATQPASHIVQQILEFLAPFETGDVLLPPAPPEVGLWMWDPDRYTHYSDISAPGYGVSMWDAHRFAYMSDTSNHGYGLPPGWSRVGIRSDRPERRPLANMENIDLSVGHEPPPPRVLDRAPETRCEEPPLTIGGRLLRLFR